MSWRTCTQETEEVLSNRWVRLAHRGGKKKKKGVVGCVSKEGQDAFDNFFLFLRYLEYLWRYESLKFLIYCMIFILSSTVRNSGESACEIQFPLVHEPSEASAKVSVCWSLIKNETSAALRLHPALGWKAGRRQRPAQITLRRHTADCGMSAEPEWSESKAQSSIARAQALNINRQKRTGCWREG